MSPVTWIDVTDVVRWTGYVTGIPRVVSNLAARYAAQPGLVDEIIVEGTRRARAEAIATLDLARQAMGLDYFPEAGVPMGGAR